MLCRSYCEAGHGPSAAQLAAPTSRMRGDPWTGGWRVTCGAPAGRAVPVHSTGTVQVQAQDRTGHWGVRRRAPHTSAVHPAAYQYAVYAQYKKGPHGPLVSAHPASLSRALGTPAWPPLAHAHLQSSRGPGLTCFRPFSPEATSRAHVSLPLTPEGPDLVHCPPPSCDTPRLFWPISSSLHALARRRQAASSTSPSAIARTLNACAPSAALRPLASGASNCSTPCPHARH